MMDPQKEKEEVIELTEVVEEGPTFAAKNDAENRPSSSPERKKDPVAPAPPEDPFSALLNLSPGTLQDTLSREAENWAAREGAPLLERLAGDLIPRLVTERLSPELMRLKGETDALRSQ